MRWFCAIPAGLHIATGNFLCNLEKRHEGCRTWARLAVPAAAVEAPAHALTETATKTRMHKAGASEPRMEEARVTKAEASESPKRLAIFCRALIEHSTYIEGGWYGLHRSGALINRRPTRHVNGLTRFTKDGRFEQSRSCAKRAL